jgi:hypothetical protein
MMGCYIGCGRKKENGVNNQPAGAGRPAAKRPLRESSISWECHVGDARARGSCVQINQAGHARSRLGALGDTRQISGVSILLFFLKKTYPFF